jgi:DNA-binding MarR family transcriptional regulator
MEQIISQNSSVYSRHLTGRARDLLLRARQKDLAPYDISPQQANLLFIIYNLGEQATFAELIKHSDRGINTLSLQITRMERDGLLEKVREKPKSTLLRFQLTEKGIDIYKKSNEMKSDKTIMSVLTEAERQQLISIMKKVIRAAEKY